MLRARHFLRCCQRAILPKQHLVLTFVYISLINLSIPRTIWIKDRHPQWWEEMVNGGFTSDDWLANFRMSRNTFVYLCNELRVDIAKRDTDMRRCITVEKRVAITLWFLATNSDYCTIGHLFGISKSSVCKIRQEVCRAIVKLLLLNKYIRLVLCLLC